MIRRAWYGIFFSCLAVLVCAWTYVAFFIFQPAVYRLALRFAGH